jgi:hypothetical protein
MPVYIDNIIEDYVVKKTNLTSKDAVIRAKKNVEAVNTVLGKEPGQVAISQEKNNLAINEGSPKDLMSGNLVDGYR